MMSARKTFETDGELDVARAHNILDLEVCELTVAKLARCLLASSRGSSLRIEAEFLNDSRVLAACKLAVVLRLRTGDHHLA